MESHASWQKIIQKAEDSTLKFLTTASIHFSDPKAMRQINCKEKTTPNKHPTELSESLLK